VSWWDGAIHGDMKAAGIVPKIMAQRVRLLGFEAVGLKNVGLPVFVGARQDHLVLFSALYAVFRVLLALVVTRGRGEAAGGNAAMLAANALDHS
jgi:hypothetical protein